MRVILGTLLVFGVAFLSVFALQLVAVTALLSWRGGGLEENGLAALLAGVPASSLALIGIALLAAPPRGAAPPAEWHLRSRDRGDGGRRPRPEPGPGVSGPAARPGSRSHARVDEPHGGRGHAARADARGGGGRPARPGGGGAVLPRLHAHA